MLQTPLNTTVLALEGINVEERLPNRVDPIMAKESLAGDGPKTVRMQCWEKSSDSGPKPCEYRHG